MLNEIQSRIMQYNRVQLNTTNSEQNTFNQFCIHLQQIFFHSCYLLIFRLQNSAENNYILFPNRTGKNPIINISLILAHINPHLWDQTTFMGSNHIYGIKPHLCHFGYILLSTCSDRSTQ